MFEKLRVLLLVGSVLVFAFVVSKIRARRARTDDMLFWIVFCIMLILLSVFPQIAFFFAKLLHFESASNFIFTFIIRILIVHEFYLSVKVSELNIKMTEIAQDIAVKTTNEK